MLTAKEGRTEEGEIVMISSQAYQNYIIDHLKNIFESHEETHYGEKEIIFSKKSGQKFVVTILSSIPGEEALVLEYQMMPNEGRFAYVDGDVFYLSDMSKEEMFQAFLESIEKLKFYHD